MHKDIVNIVRRLVFCESIKECNKRYRKHFTYVGLENRYILRYKNGDYCICYREIISQHYRKEIVCILTQTETKYKVPKNY